MAKGWILFASFFVLSISLSVQVEGIGINWGTQASHSLPPKAVIQMLKDNGIHKIKFFDIEMPILKELAGSGLDIMVGVPNHRLADMVDFNKAKQFVKENVTTYNPTSKDGVNITMVAIGNEPFLKDYKDLYINLTLPALENVQRALDEAKLGHIKATIPFNGDIYTAPYDHYVPSAGKFRDDIRDSVVPILKALDKSKAPFMVNIYPFLALYQGQGHFPIDYAFFDGTDAPVVDGDVKYDNLYEANLDTLAAALKGEGYDNMTIMVGEIGWPTDGDIQANATMASRFMNGMMKRVATGKGTALRPGYTEIYLFGLLDESLKSVDPGDFERHWGILTYDGQPKYDFDLKGENKTFIKGVKDVKYLEKKYCVAKADATDKKALDEAISYACDRTDCTATVPGASCSSLDDNGKASYAFNAYFQNTNQVKENCDFGGLAEITTKDISQGTCKFPIQLADIPATPPSAAPKASSPGGAPVKGSASTQRPLQMALALSAIILASIVL